MAGRTCSAVVNRCVQQLLRLFFVVCRQELCHSAAISFGHKRVLALGIIALLNGNRVIKTLPQNAVVNFLFTGKRQLDIIYRYNP